MKVHALREERGQILLIAALLIPVLLGMVGMAIDIGTYSANRRALQNAADGAALAGAQELPDSSAAMAKAREYAALHSIDPAHVTVAVSGGSTAPRVRVSISRTHDFAFMPILGIGSANVGAVAAAGKFSYGGGDNVVPWTVLQGDVDAANAGDEVIIKYDSQSDPGTGQFGAVRIDQSGADSYGESAMYGAESTICSVYMDGCTGASCPGGFPDTCAENSSECDGGSCDAETGNITGPTREAVEFRLQHTSTNCDSIEEAFTPVTATTYTLDPECNPWSGGACETDTSMCSRRIFLVPIIDEYTNPYEIQGFALVFLEGFEGSCIGSSCDIRVRFVNADVTPHGALGADYDPADSVHFVKLTE